MTPPASVRRATRIPSRRAALAATSAAVALALAACTSSSGDDPAPVTAASAVPSTSASSGASPSLSGSGTAAASVDAAGLAVTGEVVTGLPAPWGLAFLPDGSALVSLRDSGEIRRVVPGIGDAPGTVAPVGDVPGVVHSGEGGLLGIAVGPAFAADRRVYAMYSTASDNRIAYLTLGADNASLSAPVPILVGLPTSGNHLGGRLVFGPDGLLYASTGDAGQTDRSQDKASRSGKILRMTTDGAVPPGNPFGDSLVWSMGHRNVQGLAFDAAGRLFASEFGQNTWDELNLIQPGANYGWPVVEGKSDDPRFTPPLVQWATSDASPSGIAIVGDAVVVAALKGERLWVVPYTAVTGASVRVSTPVALLTGGYGRLRNAAVAPDGSVWVLTNATDGRGDPKPGDDRIIRLTA
ncbi:MAG: putative oxidoreductase [Pseudonocardiales bacterium]|nr:putative oxidoreductase [Pseudonocardiales bacterium]